LFARRACLLKPLVVRRFAPNIQGLESAANCRGREATLDNACITCVFQSGATKNVSLKRLLAVLTV
jgi:hypothetical protein